MDKKKLRKKSLVGWVGDGWITAFKLEDYVTKGDSELVLTKRRADTQDVKVRITVEEL